MGRIASKMIPRHLLCFIVISCSPIIIGRMTTAATTSETWLEYVSAQQNGVRGPLPDFSFSGYKSVAEPLPDEQPNLALFNVVDYGAIADDGVDDRRAIEQAIAAAEANGGGVVFFPEGTFCIGCGMDHTASIRIRKSGIVLRGSGSGRTTIWISQPFLSATPEKMWSTPSVFRVGDWVDDFNDRTIDTTVVADAEMGEFSIRVADTTNMLVGGFVVLVLHDEDAVASLVAPYPVQDEWTRLKTEPNTNEIHKIASIDHGSGVVTFSEPLKIDITAQFTWHVQNWKHVEEMGVEDLHFRGNTPEEFVHHGSVFHDSGYTALSLTRVANSWVRRCTFSNLSQAIMMWHTTKITITSVLLEGNKGHVSIHAAKSSDVLVSQSTVTASFQHGPGVAQMTSGIVFLNVSWPADTGFEAHGGGPSYATLYDDCSGGLTGGLGGATANLPQHTDFLVFWNFQCENYDEVYVFWEINSTWGPYLLHPYFVGFHNLNGNPLTTFAESQVRLNEHYSDSTVEPKSLYKAQLELRLGYLPDWIHESQYSQTTTPSPTITTTPIPPMLTRTTTQSPSSPLPSSNSISSTTNSLTTVIVDVGATDEPIANSSEIESSSSAMMVEPINTPFLMMKNTVVLPLLLLILLVLPAGW